MLILEVGKVLLVTVSGICMVVGIVYIGTSILEAITRR